MEQGMDAWTFAQRMQPKSSFIAGWKHNKREGLQVQILSFKYERKGWNVDKCRRNRHGGWGRESRGSEGKYESGHRIPKIVAMKGKEREKDLSSLYGLGRILGGGP
ncbi:unnamed protein product [Sphenostylis stenocarpa]|uniref:Uncharacterized protein n=1 Tax=Sphenostylis stenocarpa TaxID=92480 RepID=A0AA86RTF9_9FABA|nr:unnamed protein product [Sphenostylis stenocarpa]